MRYRAGQSGPTSPESPPIARADRGGGGINRSRRAAADHSSGSRAQNLLRVNDIVHEVEDAASRSSAGQQARRYRAVRDERQGGARFYGTPLPGLRAHRRDHGAPGRRGPARAGRRHCPQSEEAQRSARTALYKRSGFGGAGGLAADPRRRPPPAARVCKERSRRRTRARQARAEAEELRARVGPLADRVDERRSDEAPCAPLA